jgi:hypothetical protein
MKNWLPMHLQYLAFALLGLLLSTNIFGQSVCTTTVSTDAPITTTILSSKTSTLTIPTNGTITDVNILGLTMDYFALNSKITLTSPMGTVITIRESTSCSSGLQASLNLNIDDQATGIFVCETSGTYEPVGSLATFNNESSAGVWTLTLINGFLAGEVLTGWGLEICATPCATAPTFTQLGPYCQGVTPSTLPTTSNNGIAGTWNSAISTTTAATTTYTFTPNGCNSTATMDIVVNATPTTPIVTVVNNCGSSVLTTSGSNLSWSTGENTTSITVTTNGSYTVTQSVGGCPSLVATEIAAPVTLDLTVTVSQAMITSNQSGSTYRWLACNSNNDVIVGETSQSYTTTSNGNYSVEITQEGCVDTSTCTPIIISGIDSKLKFQKVAIYPNPVKNRLTISGLEHVKEISLIDLTGKEVLKTTNVPEKIIKMDLINISNGIYFIQIQTETNSEVYKIIKH